MQTALSKTKTPTAKITATLESSRYGGFPTPTLTITFPKGTHYRVTNAAVLRAASEIELATAPSESWCVVVEDGAVRLELADATDEEAARGMALLRSFAK